MILRTLKAVFLLSSLLLASCATPTKMAFHNDKDTVASINKPIFLMTADLKNGTRKAFQPSPLVVYVEAGAATNKKDRLNFLVDGKAGQKSNRYLLRMAMNPGDYVVRGIGAQSRTFPVIASCFAPIHADVKARNSSVYYLGHIEATIRERKGDEFRAGPVIPLVDQAAAGFSTGTFDVKITDQFAKDEGDFRAKFPALNGVKIQKAILAPFDRAKAQRFWEEKM